MRRLFLIGCLILVAFASTPTQTPVTGRWRAVLLTPGGGTQNISLELDARGETVTGNVEGIAIREGRLDGSTLIHQEYKWGMLDAPIPRRYGPV
jgi:hypothetical protein